MSKKAWLFNKWISVNTLTRRLKRLGFIEGKDFGEAELEYKGFPWLAQKPNSKEKE